MSSHLQWMIVRNNSCFLRKTKHCNFSRETNNLKNKNSFRYSGLVQKRTVDVKPCADGKGVTLVTKRKQKTRHVNKSLAKVDLKRGSRQSLRSIYNTLHGNKYRKDLIMPALRRASAILSSQKPVVAKKTRGKKTE